MNKLCKLAMLSKLSKLDKLVTRQASNYTN